MLRLTLDKRMHGAISCQARSLSLPIKAIMTHFIEGMDVGARYTTCALFASS